MKPQHGIDLKLIDVLSVNNQPILLQYDSSVFDAARYLFLVNVSVFIYHIISIGLKKTYIIRIYGICNSLTVMSYYRFGIIDE